MRDLFEIDTDRFPIRPLLPYNNPLFVHEDRSVSIVDSARHRICRFDEAGRLIGTIGGIGQRDEDLYYPAGIHGQGDLIHVLNDSGKELKVFERNGRFISKAALGERLMGSFSLLVVGDQIIIPIRGWGRSLEDVQSQKLLTVFDSQGRTLRAFGTMIQCVTAPGQNIFNSVYLVADGRIIYGAFKFLPIIFAYDIDGKEIYFKDLTKAGLPEIDALVQKAQEDNLDRPDKISIEGGAKIKNYCMGVGISKGDFFYAQADRLLVFDEKGRFRTRIHVSLDRSPLQKLEFITTGPGGSIYGLARSPNKGYVVFRMDR